MLIIVTEWGINMGKVSSKRNYHKSVNTRTINSTERKERFISMIKELIKGYYLILLVGTLCILILVIIMLFA